MERADPEIAGDLADHPLEPRFHLAGGFIRERHRQDAIRENVLGIEQVRDPVGEDAGLSGTRTGEDQNRTISAFDSSPLNVVKKFALDNHRSYLRQKANFAYTWRIRVTGTNDLRSS